MGRFIIRSLACEPLLCFWPWFWGHSSAHLTQNVGDQAHPSHGRWENSILWKQSNLKGPITVDWAKIQQVIHQHCLSAVISAAREHPQPCSVCMVNSQRHPVKDRRFCIHNTKKTTKTQTKWHKGTEIKLNGRTRYKWRNSKNLRALKKTNVAQKIVLENSRRRAHTQTDVRKT